MKVRRKELKFTEHPVLMILSHRLSHLILTSHEGSIMPMFGSMGKGSSFGGLPVVG